LAPVVGAGAPAVSPAVVPNPPASGGAAALMACIVVGECDTGCAIS
jgi:hypothetical protein